MADNGDVFAVDIDAFNRYRSDLEHLQTLSTRIVTNLTNVLNR